MLNYDNKAWLTLLFSIRGSVLKSIFPRICIFAVLSAIITLIHYFVIKINTPPTPWSIVGVALGLMLVFRTNTAYERYWEGRRMWGNIMNSTQNLALDIISYISSDHTESLKLKQKLFKLLTAFPILVKQRLREQRDFDVLKSFLTNNEIAILDKSYNMPVNLIAMIKKTLYMCLKLGILNQPHLTILNANLSDLQSSLSNCERIRYSPVPLAYVLHLKGFMYLFCLTIPFSLVSTFGWWTIFFGAMIAYVFIGIEEIGIEIEDPFGDDPNDLPLDEFCENVKSTLQDIFAKQNSL
ncbi:MAG: bestrophin family protein [Nitrospirae bacterium]|nr:bestrophin family protein [Nitrospirota bacterium]